MMGPVRFTDGTRRARFTLALDLAAIAAFIVAGMGAHADDGAASIFLRNFIPFSAAWLVTAWFARTYRPPTSRSLLITIVVAIPCGVLLRAAWVRSWTTADVLTFMAVALLFASIFVGIGRVIAATVGARLFGEGS
jgi:glycopeptide antibiotics resistance protein